MVIKKLELREKKVTLVKICSYWEAVIPYFHFKGYPTRLFNPLNKKALMLVNLGPTTVFIKPL